MSALASAVGSKGGVAPPRPPQTFAKEADRERLTPASLEALRSMAKVWKLTTAEAAALLSVSNTTWDRIRRIDQKSFGEDHAAASDVRADIMPTLVRADKLDVV